MVSSFEPSQIKSEVKPPQKGGFILSLAFKEDQLALGPCDNSATVLKGRLGVGGREGEWIDIRIKMGLKKGAD